jgi:hypothetical protein
MPPDRPADTPRVGIIVISKDEAALATTLDGLRAQLDTVPVGAELLVVDASVGRLRSVQHGHPDVRWIDFVTGPGPATTIPHQRNAGVAAARGEIVVFIDAGCTPHEEWLANLLRPIVEHGESESLLAHAGDAPSPNGTYVAEAATLNLAVHRSVFQRVGGFDESFAYGSDLDFTWRAVEAGERIKLAGDAVVSHDWGTWQRQLRRGRHYGQAKARL